MADAERISAAQDQVEDTKEATLPLTPVSDSDGFKHGDHEDHADTPNGTPVPAESANDAPEADKTLEAASLPEQVEAPPTEPVPMASPPPKPKAAVSLDARTRKPSLQVGKTDPKATAASSVRKVCFNLRYDC
ncbi:hypothetical protein FRC12_008081 [Ceratobasidium sp. 428]|nr:hypothetical protein FRC12_008081 [Ceratobasidium sp. 428]